MDKNKPHIFIRILKFLGWTLLSLGIILIVARLSLKTTWVHNLVKKQVVSIAGQSLNGTLSIDRIDGDLWQDFSVKGLTISQKDTLLNLDSLNIQYDVWKLLGRTFSASQISLYNAETSIIETSEKRFNFQDLIISDTTESSSSFGIDIEQLEILNSSISIKSPSYLPDSTLTIRNLNASAGFSIYDEFSASLTSLSFQAVEGRLPEPIAIQTSASYENQIITLNQLVVETGRSVLRSQGVTNLKDSTLSAQAETLPFSFKDIQPYLESPLPDNDFQLTLKASGHIDALRLELQAEGRGFENLLVVSEFSLSDTPTIQKFDLSGKNLDVAYLTDDSLDAEIGDFQITLEGQVNQNLPATDISWGFTLNNIRYQTYLFKTLFGSGTIANENLTGNIQLNNGKDEIALNPQVDHLFSDEPSWNIDGMFSNIDLGWWTQNPSLKSSASFSANATGKGFELSETPWEFSLSQNNTPSTVDTLTIAYQKISDLNITGNISTDNLNAEGYVQFIKNKVFFSSTISDLLEEDPSYIYKVHTPNFDAREINGVEDFPTSINLKAEGSGQYFDPDKIQLSTNLVIDSSFVNGASFNLLDISATLEKNILTISRGELISDVIEGTFSGRKNLEDPADPDNEFTMDMQVKNLQPLASLAGAEALNATGRITGNIKEVDVNTLQFDGNVELNEIHYDTLFSAQSIVGNTKITIGDTYNYDLSLDISQPAYTTFNLQDIKLGAQGISTTDTLSGNFNLEIESEDAGQITQSANFTLNYENLHTILTWDTFSFQTPARNLSLQSPFSLTYLNSSVQTDTLRLRSAGGTFLHMAVPYADSLEQEIWIQGQDFDFGVIQEIIFEERFVDGILSGDLHIDNKPTGLTGDGVFSISNLSYEDTDIDELNLDFSIVSERLTARLNMSIAGEEKVVGNINIPFILADPSTFEDSFYEEPVSGKLVINPIQLSEFKNLLSAFQITGTEGILSFNGELSGTAGEPDFEGSLNLGEPTLSGIKVDTAFARFNYHHLEKKVTALAEIDARGQKAAHIDADLPISMDFRTLKMNMPVETDSLSINLITDNFNISVFNDFLNKQYMNRLRGDLNANVNISGTKNNLNSDGFLKLSNAQVEVPIAGITLSGITSEIGLTNTGIHLRNLKTTSGSGSFTANGSVDLEGITPTNLNITAKATRFRLANTSDYNLTIDLDSKLTGKPTQPKASGKLTVKNGFIFMQDFGERSVETVELEEETTSFSPYDSLSIDMQFEIERNFLLRNRRYLDLEIALTGELDAQKQKDEELQLFGTLVAERGYVRPLGKQFTLNDGNFTFSGPLDEPDIFIKTSYIPQTTQKQGSPITLHYIIEGNAADPEFRFESDPQMEQQDIICYTLFNKPCYALESWQQAISGSGSGSSPTDLLVGALLDEVESLATQQLGIDVVQIDNTRSSSGGGTSIKTGWYLNRRTFFAIVNEISGSTPHTLFILEYLLTKNIDLIITQGDDNREGIDIRWQYDY